MSKTKLTKDEWDLFVGIYLDGIKLLESEQTITPKMKKNISTINMKLNKLKPSNVERIN